MQKNARLGGKYLVYRYPHFRGRICLTQLKKKGKKKNFVEKKNFTIFAAPGNSGEFPVTTPKKKSHLESTFFCKKYASNSTKCYYDVSKNRCCPKKTVEQSEQIDSKNDTTSAIIWWKLHKTISCMPQRVLQQRQGRNFMIYAWKWPAERQQSVHYVKNTTNLNHAVDH